MFKPRGVNCHENGGSMQEKSTTFDRRAIFMLREAPEAMTPVEKSR